METVNLKKGLFGYTPSSVQEYVEALNAEFSGRANNLVLENEELKKKCELLQTQIDDAITKQNEFLEKIGSMSEEIESLISEKSKLNGQIDDLKHKLDEETKDKFDYEQGQNELADVMIEAKRFANDLKNKTEMEFEQKRAANNDVINKEKHRIEKYIFDIDEISEILHKICDDFAVEIKNKKTELNIILNNINDFNVKQNSLQL